MSTGELRSHYEERFTKHDPYECGHPEMRFALMRGYAKLDLVNRLSQDWQVQCSLDVGCGDWGIFYQIPRLTGARLTVAGDIAFRAVQKACQRSLSSKTQFVVLDAEHLPFCSHVFDFVYCSEVLEHLPYADAPLGEIRRLATDHVILSVPNEQLVGKLEAEHVQTFGYRSFVSALCTAGLRVRRVLGIYSFIRRVPHRRLPYLPLGKLLFRLLMKLGQPFPQHSLQILAVCEPGEEHKQSEFHTRKAKPGANRTIVFGALKGYADRDRSE